MHRLGHKSEQKMEDMKMKKKLNEMKADIKYIFKMLAKPKGTVFEINGEKVNRFQYIRDTLRFLKEIRNDVIVRAKFGKGRKSRIKEWRFESRKKAVLFGKVFLRYNPKCTTYMVMGE